MIIDFRTLHYYNSLFILFITVFILFYLLYIFVKSDPQVFTFTLKKNLEKFQKLRWPLLDTVTLHGHISGQNSHKVM